MSNYFLIEISDGDSKIKGMSVYGYDASNDAIADFFDKKGTAMGSDLYTFELVMVVDTNNSKIKTCAFKREGATINNDKLYMLEVKTTTEDVETKNISSFDDPILAEARLSKKMASAMKDENCKSEQLLIFNTDGGSADEWSEVYTAPTPEPEPEPETTE